MEIPYPSEQSQSSRRSRNVKLAVLIIAILAVALVTGVGGYMLSRSASNNANDQNQATSSLTDTSSPSATNSDQSSANSSPDSTGSLSFSQIYTQDAPSVVVIEDFQTAYDMFNQAYYEGVQGSGFVYDLNGKDVIITNDHVVDGGVNITVTFQDGNTYTGTVLGTDVYSDLAVLSTVAPQSEFAPLTIVSSAGLQVGDEVVAIGQPLWIIRFNDQRNNQRSKPNNHRRHI